MLATREELLKRIKSDILAIEPSAEIILFGSRARGDAREASDWDVLVLVDGVVDRLRKEKLISYIYNIELEYEVCLSTFLKSKIEWETPFNQASALNNNIEEEGIHL